MRTPLLTLALCAALSACAGSAPAPASPGDIASEGRAEEGWLVWSGGEEPRTIWLSASGEPIAERTGLVVAANGALLGIEREVETIRLPTCDQIEAEQHATPSGEEGTRTRLVAVELGTGRRTPLLEPLDPAGAASLQHEIVPIASLGPLLFARERAETFACGAHGNVEVAMRVLDLRTGSVVELPVEPPSDLRARARDALLAESEGALDPPLELEAVHRVATVPVFVDGRVAVEHVFTAEACYACGDGEWSSYTRATRLRDPRVPPALEQHALVPEAIARWLAAHPQAHGISRASGAQLAAFRGER